MIRTRSMFTLTVLLFITSAAAHAGNGEETPKRDVSDGFAVVEIFTSQGCSSCPPADDFLKRMDEQAREKAAKSETPGEGKVSSAEGNRVYVLSWHVDYWDYIGWKDPYGSAEISKRQFLYTQAAKKRGRWTPHLLCNGVTYRSGKAWQEAVKQGLATPGKATLSLSATCAEPTDQKAVSSAAKTDRDRPKSKSESRKEGQGKDSAEKATPGDASGTTVIAVAAKVTKAPAKATVVFALAERGLVTKVTAGENKGKTLSHPPVVRAWAAAALDKEGTARAKLTVPADLVKANTEVIAYVQTPDAAIHAAARCVFPKPAMKREGKAKSSAKASADKVVHDHDPACADGVCFLPGEPIGAATDTSKQKSD